MVSAAPPQTAAADLRRRWLDSAFGAASIDASHWDPSRGVDVNRRTVERVYAYYGNLYLAHDRLQWAGMANLIGPSFYAGFLDVGFLPDVTRRLFAAVGRAWRSGKRRLLRQAVSDTPLVGELGFFETTFLTMQRKIFEDQALMHEAYLHGGVAAIQELGDAGVLDSATVEAWRLIDSADPDSVRSGNRTLLYREQHDIIDRFYVEMTDYRPPAGRFFTYALTLVGAPAIPGAKTYCDVFPLILLGRFSRKAWLALRTPLAAGNLARFANRWELIEQNTLPVYQQLVSDDAAEVRRLVDEPLVLRMRSFRLVHRAGRLALALLTHWRLGVEHAAPTVSTPVARLELDLTAPPTREASGMADRAASRVWVDPNREPFRIDVTLPTGAVFTADATLVAMLSPRPDSDPTRLLVKLPATDLDGARLLLDELAPTLDLDQADIDLWAARAASATPSTHVYSTRVFRARHSGPVTVEIQAEHHLEHDRYVIDALFSWSS